MTHSRLFILALATLSFSAASQALAQSAAPKEGLMPPVTEKSEGVALTPLDSETHPVLKLTPDKSELVRLDKEASSVVVGNPSHITVLLDTPKLAVVVPRQPGATYFSVLDKDGNIIMQRHVVVGSTHKNYVRIRRSCSAATQSQGGAPCQPTSVYFCPDMCHEIGAGGGDGTESQ